MDSEKAVDCIYVTAPARDACYMRICVASVHYFYPRVLVRILAEGVLEDGLARNAE
jgi:hypothetical protein